MTAVSFKKTMKVRENTFRKLEDPFENGVAKKYVFYVKVDDETGKKNKMIDAREIVAIISMFNISLYQ